MRSFENGCSRACPVPISERSSVSGPGPCDAPDRSHRQIFDISRNTLFGASRSVYLAHAGVACCASYRKMGELDAESQRKQAECAAEAATTVGGIGCGGGPELVVARRSGEQDLGIHPREQFAESGEPPRDPR